MGGQYDLMPPLPPSRPPNQVETSSSTTDNKPSTNWDKAPQEVRLESVTKAAFQNTEPLPEKEAPSLKGRISIQGFFSKISDYVKESALGRFFGNLAAKIGGGKVSEQEEDLSFHVTEKDPYVAEVSEKNEAPQKSIKTEVSKDPGVILFKNQGQDLKEGAEGLKKRADLLAKNGSPSVLEAHRIFKETADTFIQNNEKFQEMNPSDEDEYELFGSKRMDLEDEYGRVEAAFRNLEEKVKQ